MKKNRPVTTIFKTCPNEHNTTLEEHFIYDASNKRLCRACVQENKTAKLSRNKGTFS